MSEHEKALGTLPFSRWQTTVISLICQCSLEYVSGPFGVSDV